MDPLEFAKFAHERQQRENMRREMEKQTQLLQQQAEDANRVVPTKLPEHRQAGAKFCHECGQSAQSNDKFCVGCGTSLRTPPEESELMAGEPEVGRIYHGTVVTIKEYGCFVEFMIGKKGLCHISELASTTPKRTEDVVKEGDRISVKLLDIGDSTGNRKYRLSRKETI